MTQSAPGPDHRRSVHPPLRVLPRLVPDDHAVSGSSTHHLLAGRSPALQLTALGLVLVGASTDTVAFKTSLDVFLRAAEWQSWVVAVGATALALLAAAGAGIELTALRRGERGALAGVLACGSVWLLLGLSLFAVRWNSGSLEAVTGLAADPAVHQVRVARGQLGALFFGALYLVSGVTAAGEVSRSYEPRYTAFRRLSRQVGCEQRQVARLAGVHERARHVVALQERQADRERASYAAACRERVALGAEAANYARQLIAVRLADPSCTDLTLRGPRWQQVHPPLPGPTVPAVLADPDTTPDD